MKLQNLMYKFSHKKRLLFFIHISQII